MKISRVAMFLVIILILIVPMDYISLANSRAVFEDPKIQENSVTLKTAEEMFGITPTATPKPVPISTPKPVPTATDTPKPTPAPAVNKPTATGGSVPVPIIMYHSILMSSEGDNSFVISKDELRKDLTYLKENGYTTITMSELIAYVNEPEAVLPAKPIILSFDDGYYNNYLYAYPLIKEYNAKCVLSVIGTLTDNHNTKQKENDSDTFLNMDQIIEMHRSGNVEIQSHSYNMHSLLGDRIGILKKDGESSEEYAKALTEDAMKLQYRLIFELDYIPNTYTFPYGKMSKDSDKVLTELGFKATMTTKIGINQIKKGSSLLDLKRYNRDPNISSDDFFKKVVK